MRYSRFRASMLGLEPQKRNRNKPAQSKVTKSTKVARPKKEDLSKLKAVLKPDPAATPSKFDAIIKSECVKVKQEQAPAQAECHVTPVSMVGPLVPEAHPHLHPRLPTPCSDSDLLAPSQIFESSPASDLLHSEASFDFGATPSQCTHHQESWHQHSSPLPFQPFGMQFDLDDFTASFCEHQHGHHDTAGLSFPGTLLNTEQGHNEIRHDPWTYPKSWISKRVPSDHKGVGVPGLFLSFGYEGGFYGRRRKATPFHSCSQAEQCCQRLRFRSRSTVQICVATGRRNVMYYTYIQLSYQWHIS